MAENITISTMESSGLSLFWFNLYSKYHPYTIDCLLPYFLSLLAYVAFNIPFLVLDLHGCPSWLLRYKVQPAQNVPVKPELVYKCIKPLFINVVIVAFLWGNFLYYVRLWRGSTSGPQLPSLLEVVIHLALIYLIEDVGFYYGHRFFHSSFMYRRFHKKHHEWTAPISIVSVYCHPLEHLITNLGPVGLGPLLVGAHTFTLIIWHTLALFNTTCTHSGYAFPGLPSPKFHDYHHEKFNECYGALGLLDYLHGTDRRYRDLNSKKSGKVED